MNKLDPIETLKTEAGLTKNEAATVVNLFFDEISNAMASGDRVEIRGLFSFYVKKYKAYTGRYIYRYCQFSAFRPLQEIKGV
jgi:integration host factor subunit beta